MTLGEAYVKVERVLRRFPAEWHVEIVRRLAHECGGLAMTSTERVKRFRFTKRNGEVERLGETDSDGGTVSSRHHVVPGSSPSSSDPAVRSESRITTEETSRSSERRACARRLLTFLNEKASKHFEPVESNLSLLVSLLKEGRSEADIRGVIVKKCRDWKADPKMHEYLRPLTLFSKSKFAQYRGEIPHDVED